MSSLNLRSEGVRKCLASGRGYEVHGKPPYRVQLKLKCPGSLLGRCAETEHIWYCAQCINPIEFINDDEYFYCSCGKAKRETFNFKCTAAQHGREYTCFPAKELNKYVKPICELNILVIGVFEDETPAWINSFINYIAYPSLEEAAKSELFSAMPFSFDIIDKNDVVQHIKLETPNVQINAEGVSVNCFAVGSTLVRLIDIPGIRSAVHVENMKKEYQKTLAYLRGLKELHGICILLNPDEPKFDEHFELCIRELKGHFYWTMTKNIVFCFTNSVGAPHQAAAMRVSLSKFLMENQLDIALDKSRLFRMDNGAFRFLYAQKQSVQFEKKSEQDCSQNWAASVLETERLILYFQSIKPHNIEDTMSLVVAKRNIIALIKPIGDILECIQGHIIGLTDKSKNKYYPKFYCTMTVKQADDLQTTCTNENCKFKATGLICHENCCLEDIPLGIVGDKRLRDCWAMDNGESLYCTGCGCFWEHHQLINLPQQQEEFLLSDKSLAPVHVIRALREESKFIIGASVKIGRYLSKLAFMSYNDIFMQYFNILIKKQEVVDPDLSERLVEVRCKYFQEYKLLEKAMAVAKAKELDGVGFVKILSELCALKYYGERLKVFIAPVLNRKEEKREVSEFYQDLSQQN